MENPLNHTKNSLDYTKRLLVFVSLWFVFFSGLPLVAKGAILYLEPSQGQYQPGDTFIVEIKIDTEGECINAIEANLSFSQDILKAVDFSQGDSILTLWVKKPTFSVVSCGEANVSCGLVSFIGGIPGGYCGRIPGDPGTSNLLGQIIFMVPGMIVQELGENVAEIKFLENSQTLLNDGFGTPAKLTVKGSTIKITEVGPLQTPKDEWGEELNKDNVTPESFKIELHQDPTIFEGKYFVTFSTTDKQTGIDYYEIKEGKKDWKRGESPYLLENQSLGGIIKVKAVDKAGNERIAEYVPKKPFPWWGIFAIIVGLAIIGWFIKKHLRKT